MYESSALIGIAVSAIEVFKKECYGALLGYKKRGRFTIAEAVPYQTAERSYSSVILEGASEERVTEILNSLPWYSFLGEYHSHPAYGLEKGSVILSDMDCDNSEAGKLEVVVAVNPLNRQMPWRLNKDQTISGSISGYHLKICTYLMEPNMDGKLYPWRLPVSTPMIRG